MPATRSFRSIALSIMTITLMVVTLAYYSPVSADDTSRMGVFTGMSNHVTTGSVTVVKGTDGVQIILGADFSFDGAPDPKVAFGKDGEYDPATLIAPLQSNTGEQTYTVPASINIDDYNEVYIWCEKFSVGLGVAPIAAL